MFILPFAWMNGPMAPKWWFGRKPLIRHETVFQGPFIGKEHNNQLFHSIIYLRDIHICTQRWYTDANDDGPVDFQKCSGEWPRCRPIYISFFNKYTDFCWCRKWATGSLPLKYISTNELPAEPSCNRCAPVALAFQHVSLIHPRCFTL